VSGDTGGDNATLVAASKNRCFHHIVAGTTRAAYRDGGGGRPPPPPEARCRGPHGSRVRRQTPSASLAAGVGHQAPGSRPTEGGGRFPQLLPRRGGANGRSAVASAGQ
jgi:hypothetical protein